MSKRLIIPSIPGTDVKFSQLVVLFRFIWYFPDLELAIYYLQYRVSKKKDSGFALDLYNQVSNFQIAFFSWKLRSICKFLMQKHFFTVITSIQSVWVTRPPRHHLAAIKARLGPIGRAWSKFWSHLNGFVFRICIWISVFRRKKPIENPMLGCREICKINTGTFFLKHPVESLGAIKKWPQGGSSQSIA